MDVHHGIFIYVSLKISSTLYYFVISSIRQNNWNKLCFSFSSRWYFSSCFVLLGGALFRFLVFRFRFFFKVILCLVSFCYRKYILSSWISEHLRKMQEEFFLYRLQFLFELSQLFIFFFWLRLRIFFASSSNDFLFLGGIGMENWSWSSRKILFWMMIMMLTGKNYHPLEQFLEWTFLEDVGRFERFPPNITCL